MTKDKNFYKTFFRLLVIIALQNIVVYAVNLADNVMIGAYSETSMAGVALVNQIQFLLQMLSMAVGEGAVVIASRFWGKKDTAPIKDVAALSMWLGLVIAAVIWAVVFFFPQEVLSLFSGNEAEISEGVRYMRIVCFTYIFFMMSSVLLAVMRSVETVVIGFVVSVIAFFVNVGLNRCLIFGWMCFPEMGVEGAAIATLISRVVEFLIVFIYVLFVDKKVRLKVGSFFRTDKRIFRNYMKVTYPMLLSYTSWGVAMSVQLAVLGHLSVSGPESVVAASSIANTLFSVVSVACYGAASASSVMIGKTIGQGKTDKLKEYSRSFQILFIAIGLFTGALLFFSKGFVLSFYEVLPETAVLAESFMDILSVTVVGTSYQVACLTVILRGAGDTRFVLFNDLIWMWGIVLPVSVLSGFVFNLSPVIVFICLKNDQITKCFVALFKVNGSGWIKKCMINI